MQHRSNKPSNTEDTLMYGCQVVKPITLMKSIEKEGTIANFKANVAALEFIAVKFAEEDCIKDLASSP